MTGFIPQLSLVTTAAGALMIRLGVTRGLLQPRKAPRRCPSCGRLINGHVCAICTRSPLKGRRNRPTYPVGTPERSVTQPDVNSDHRPLYALPDGSESAA